MAKGSMGVSQGNVSQGLWRGVGAVGLMLGAIVGGSSVLPSPAIAQAVPGDAPSDTAQTTTQVKGPLPIPSRSEVSRLPRPNKFPEPAIRINPDANIYLVNYTNAKIDYAVLGMTGESLLTGLLEAPARSVAELPRLELPVNLSLGRQDNGFMLVRPLVKQGDLYLIMDFAPTLQLDTNYINIKENGEVYLY
ncbi:MAG: hypothetical protein AAGF75_08725 [Cyanobacteria bacterium P01_H01_bin.130]